MSFFTFFTRWIWMLSGESLILLLLEAPLKGTALPPIRYSHAGICPNDMNPNLWVDAQSTCRRECDTDLVSDALLFLLLSLNLIAFLNMIAAGCVDALFTIAAHINC